MGLIYLHPFTRLAVRVAGLAGDLDLSILLPRGLLGDVHGRYCVGNPVQVDGFCPCSLPPPGSPPEGHRWKMSFHLPPPASEQVLNYSRGILLNFGNIDENLDDWRLVY
jgi:hypothetical protein